MVEGREIKDMLERMTMDLANFSVRLNQIKDQHEKYFAELKKSLKVVKRGDKALILFFGAELIVEGFMKVQRWILSLLKPKERPTTRALKAGFISTELLTKYCKLIGHKYPGHICSKCNGEDNIIPDVDLE
ncbi:hypothetical protein H5410_041686 [Solanum commersonii]|uniref:Uncharacterized protein n=1 Tax=Solanum commersonii TaxID=4109 RepID=A0A9J5XVA0_SOLCO|nr:hypothetical protein H5410_041686 [Solanum commersonii]